MNKLSWDIRKILKLTAFSGLTICATMVSGYQAPVADLSSTKPQSSPIKAEVQQIYVEVVSEGALYLTRDHNKLLFWLIQGEDIGARVLLHEITEIPVDSPAQVNVKVDGISSVFYSDNLLQPDSVTGQTSIKYSVSGSFKQGQAVLPIAKSKFEPLFAVHESEAKPIHEFTGVEALFFEQMEVYAQVAEIENSQATHAENFVTETTQLLQDYATAVLELSENTEQLLSHNEEQSLTVVDAGTAQVVQDLVAVSQVEDELNTLIRKNKDLTAYYFDCINQGEVQLQADMQAFADLADTYTEESDTDDPLEDPLDDLSEQQEDAYDLAQEDMHNCVGTEASIEQMATYQIPVNIEEEGSYHMVAEFETTAMAMMQAAELQGSKAHDIGMSFVDRAYAIAKVDDLNQFEHAFDAWVSPNYLAYTGFNAKTAWEDRIDYSKITDSQTKASETLCENYTDFDLEFNVAGVGVVIGTPLDDRIKTGNEANLVVTLQGEDCIESHGGVDFVFSGPDEDKIFGGDHHDFLIGGKDNDEIHGSAGKSYTWGNVNVDIGNLILGAGGDDSLFGGEDDADKGEDGTVATQGFTDIILGDLWFTGDAGADTIKGERGIDFIFGEQGNDTLSNAYTGAINIYGVNIKMGSFFFAGSGNDSITGSNSTGAGLTQLLGDFIFGSEGNDTANGRGGFDFMFGGAGNDVFSGGDYIDLVFGNSGDDTVKGDDGIDLVSGDSGSDKVYGNDGAFDLLLGGVGNDGMFGGKGVDLIFGSQGNDRIEGNESIDLIFAGAGTDTAHGGDGVDLIFGSQGADFLYGNAGVDIIFGGDDGDYIAGGADTDVIFGNENAGTSKRDELHGEDGVDIIFGNRGEDYINGGNGTDVLFGNADNDEIVGGAGVDIMFGNTGDDNLSGEAGTDVMFGNDGNDQMSGGDSTDVMFGNMGCDVINGGGSTDVLFGNSGADKILAGEGTDVVFGNSGNDMLYGEGGTDVLFGNSDNDYISAGSGTNIVFGNSGNDHIIGGANKDIIWGNSGNDYIAGGADKDLIWGNRGNDTIDGGSSGDIIFGNRDNDLINAGHGTDWIWGNRGDDRIRGLEGKNRIWGNRGNDILDGYLGGGDTKDKLRGNRHSDTLTGNSSNTKDKLRGGAGSDNKMRNVTLLPASLFIEPTYQVDACLQ